MPNTSDVLLTMMMSGLITGGTNITLEVHDEPYFALKRNIFIGVITYRAFVHSSFAPTGANHNRIVLVKGIFKEYWFPKLLLLFRLRMTENESTFAEYAFGQFFEIAPPLGTEDGTLNCFLCNRQQMIKQSVQLTRKVRRPRKLKLKNGMAGYRSL